MQIETLTPEQCERIANAQGPEEILAIAAEEGYELSEEELDEISGGDWSIKDKIKKALQCPNCGSYEVHRFPQPGVTGVVQCACKSGGFQWNKTLGLDSYVW